VFKFQQKVFNLNNLNKAFELKSRLLFKHKYSIRIPARNPKSSTKFGVKQVNLTPAWYSNPSMVFESQNDIQNPTCYSSWYSSTVFEPHRDFGILPYGGNQAWRLNHIMVVGTQFYIRMFDSPSMLPTCYSNFSAVFKPDLDIRIPRGTYILDIWMPSSYLNLSMVLKSHARWNWWSLVFESSMVIKPQKLIRKWTNCLNSQVVRTPTWSEYWPKIRIPRCNSNPSLEFEL
jgi:hypothetical protein